MFEKVCLLSEMKVIFNTLMSLILFKRAYLMWESMGFWYLDTKACGIKINGD